MPCFINTNLISSLLDPILVDPGSTLIHAGAYSLTTLILHHVKKNFSIFPWK